MLILADACSKNVCHGQGQENEAATIESRLSFGQYMGGIMVLLFGSIAGIGLKTIIDGKVDLLHPRNLCLVSVTMVTCIGGLGVTIGGFSLQGISLCGVLAVLLNQLLPRAQVEPAGAKSTGEGLK